MSNLQLSLVLITVIPLIALFFIIWSLRSFKKKYLDKLFSLGPAQTMQINDSEGRISSLNPLRRALCATLRLAHLLGIAHFKMRNLLLRVHLFFFMKVTISKKKLLYCNWLFLECFFFHRSFLLAENLLGYLGLFGDKPHWGLLCKISWKFWWMKKLNTWRVSSVLLIH